MANVIRNELTGKKKSATIFKTFNGNQEMKKINAIEINRILVFRALRCNRVRSFGNCVVDVLLRVRDLSFIQSRVYTTETIIIGPTYWISIERTE